MQHKKIWRKWQGIGPSGGVRVMSGSWDRDKLPNLIDGVYKITSCFDTRYNCIAWAADDTKAWWWPSSSPDYWPIGGNDIEPTIWAFAEAFETLGYVECQDPSPEDGWEKIAIFATLEDGELMAQHATWQLEDGSWPSKLGDFEDISHSKLADVHCEEYGVDLLYMRRRRSK
jgi:hypothetical protein